MILYLTPFLFAVVFSLVAIGSYLFVSLRSGRLWVSLSALMLGFSCVIKFLFGACLALFLVSCCPQQKIEARAHELAQQLNAKEAEIKCKEAKVGTDTYFCVVKAVNFEGELFFICDVTHCADTRYNAALLTN